MLPPTKASMVNCNSSTYDGNDADWIHPDQMQLLHVDAFRHLSIQTVVMEDKSFRTNTSPPDVHSSTNPPLPNPFKVLRTSGLPKTSKKAHQVQIW